MAAMSACAADVSTSGEPQSLGPSPAATADPAVPSPSIGASPGASDPASPLTIAWEPSDPFDGQVTEVYADGDTWIAGGFDAVDGPAAWTAADARTWVRSMVENQQPDETFGGPRLGPMTRLGDSLLSFGTFIGCCDGRGVYGWRSADGKSWEAIESASPLFVNGYFVHEIAAGDRPWWRSNRSSRWMPGGSGPGPRRQVGSKTTPGDPTTRPPASSRSMSSGRVTASWRSVPAAIPSFASHQPPGRGCRPTGRAGRSRCPVMPSACSFFGRRPLPAGGFAALGSVEMASASPDATLLAFTSPDGLTGRPRRSR